MDPATPSAIDVEPPTPHLSYKQHHRLLYRGSLSLPDSDLILDGTHQSPISAYYLT